MNIKKKFEGERGTVFTMVYPIIYIVLGVMLVAFKDMKPEVFAYLIGASAIIVGISAIANFFVRELYYDFHNYSFSIGILMMALGVCIMIKANDLSGVLMDIIKVCVLLTAVIKIQQAIQLVCLKNVMWIPVLSISVLVSGFVIFLFINSSMPREATYITLIVDGALSLLINLFVFILSKRLKKKAMAAPTQTFAPTPAYDRLQENSQEQAIEKINL